MSKLFHPLLTLIATATDRQLAHHLEYFKDENRILRARIPKQIHTTPKERARLLKLGTRLGKGIDLLIGIVAPSTFHRWVREEKRGRRKAEVKRPRRDLRELVRRIAEETGSGYTRIPGELRKLGIRRICRQPVKNILKEQGTSTSLHSQAIRQKLKSDRELCYALDLYRAIIASRFRSGNETSIPVPNRLLACPTGCGCRWNGIAFISNQPDDVWPELVGIGPLFRAIRSVA